MSFLLSSPRMKSAACLWDQLPSSPPCIPQAHQPRGPWGAWTGPWPMLAAAGGSVMGCHGACPLGDRPCPLACPLTACLAGPCCPDDRTVPDLTGPWSAWGHPGRACVRTGRWKPLHMRMGQTKGSGGPWLMWVRGGTELGAVVLVGGWMAAGGGTGCGRWFPHFSQQHQPSGSIR